MSGFNVVRQYIDLYSGIKDLVEPGIKILTLRKMPKRITET